MKQLALILALVCTLTSRSRASENALTAAELADHLGIKNWVSKAHLQGSEYQCEVIHVEKAKEVRSILSGFLFPNDREFTPFAIQVSETLTGMKLTMNTSSTVMRQGLGTIPLGVRRPLPSVLAPGEYVLGGDIPDKRLGPNKPPLGINDITDGLLLRVTKMQGLSSELYVTASGLRRGPVRPSIQSMISFIVPIMICGLFFLRGKEVEFTRSIRLTGRKARWYGVALIISAVPLAFVFAWLAAAIFLAQSVWSFLLQCAMLCIFIGILAIPFRTRPSLAIN